MIGGLIGKAIGGVPVEEVQMVYLRPDADSSLGGWTDQAGGTVNIYQAIDEVIADDLDAVGSPSEGGAASLAVRLFQGSTEIAEWTHSGMVVNVPYDAVQTLTAPQFAAITNPADLFVEFEDNAGNIYRFSVGNPAAGLGEPVSLKYRYGIAVG